MNRKIKTILITALISLFNLCGPNAYSQQFPIVLKQDLPKAPRIVRTTGDYDIQIVRDTANFISIITYGTVDVIDSLQFPSEKLSLSEGQFGTTLTFSNGFPYHNRIQLHTTASNMSLNATGESIITLSDAQSDTLTLDALVLQTEGNSIISVKQPLIVKTVHINAKDYSMVRHNTIHADRVQRDIFGGARIVENGKAVDEAPLAILYRQTGEQGAFMDFSGGTSYLASRPFGGSNMPTGNFVWGTGFHYSFSGRIATWQRPHWGLSTGLGFKVETYHTDNAFLDLIVDTVSGLTSLQAVDASSIFGPSNSNISWSSTMMSSQFFIPIHLEWRKHNDYRGLRIGAELRPGITIFNKSFYLVRTGFCQDQNKAVTSNNESLGKYYNRFQLGAKFSVSYDKLSFFVESTLTPLFRSRTGQSNSRPALDQKLYPFSAGFSITL